MAELVINDILLGGRNVENEEAARKREFALSAYDPQKTPADLDLAQKHGKAKKVYIKNHEDHEEGEEEVKEVCVCCGLPLEGDLIPINACLDKLYYLGSGFALYFRFIKYTIGFLLLVFMVGGIYNLITNSIGSDCSEPDDAGEEVYCNKGYILSYALPNKRTESDLLTAQAALNLATVILIMFFFHYLRYQFRKTEIQADDRTITPSDYTIVIEGVAPETTNREIVEWIKGFATPTQPLIIEKIIRPYVINEYIHLMDERNAIVKHEKEHEKSGKMKESEEKKLEAQLEAIDKKLEALRKDGAIKRCPYAYVTFSLAAQADFVSSKFKKPLFTKMFGIFMSKFVSTFDQIKGVRVEVERAPEPSDIMWLNLKYTDRQRDIKRHITSFCTLVMVVLSFGIILLCNWGQSKAIDTYGKGSSTVQGLSIVASVVIVITNTVLTLTIDFLTKFEKHETTTKFLKGVTQKLVVAQFVNTALTTIFAELILGEPHHEEDSRIQSMNFYGTGGLLENIYWVFITNAFMGPLLSIIDPAYYVKLLLQRRVLKQGKQNTLTQKDAHMLFEGTALNMPAKYAAMLKIILMTTFYAPALPFALVFTIIGLFLSYWADKYCLLRRNALPNSLDDDLTDAMVEMLEWAAFTFALGNLLYMYTLEDVSAELAFSSDAFIMAWVTLGISLFHIFFPMEALNTKLFPIPDNVTETLTYSHAKHEFHTDYELEDPNTKANAMTRFIKQVKNLPQTSSPDKFFQVVKKEMHTVKEISQEGGPTLLEPEIDFRSLDRYCNRLADDHDHHDPQAPKTRPGPASPRQPNSGSLRQFNNASPRQPTSSNSPIQQSPSKTELLKKLKSGKKEENSPGNEEKRVNQDSQNVQAIPSITQHEDVKESTTPKNLNLNKMESNSKESKPQSTHLESEKPQPNHLEARLQAKPEEERLNTAKQSDDESANLNSFEVAEASDTDRREATINRNMLRQASVLRDQSFPLN